MPRSAVDEVQFQKACVKADERASRHDREFVVVEDRGNDINDTYPFMIISRETYEAEYSDSPIEYSTEED